MGRAGGMSQDAWRPSCQTPWPDAQGPGSLWSSGAFLSAGDATGPTPFSAAGGRYQLARRSTRGSRFACSFNKSGLLTSESRAAWLQIGEIIFSLAPGK